jgi:hypothetical protein
MKGSRQAPPPQNRLPNRLVRDRVARYVASQSGIIMRGKRLVFRPDAPAPCRVSTKSGYCDARLCPIAPAGPEFEADCDKLAQSIVYAAGNLTESRPAGEGTITVTGLAVWAGKPEGNKMLMRAEYYVDVDDAATRRGCDAPWEETRTTR